MTNVSRLDEYQQKKLKELNQEREEQQVKLSQVSAELDAVSKKDLEIRLAAKEKLVSAITDAIPVKSFSVEILHLEYFSKDNGKTCIDVRLGWGRSTAFNHMIEYEIKQNKWNGEEGATFKIRNLPDVLEVVDADVLEPILSDAQVILNAYRTGIIEKCIHEHLGNGEAARSARSRELEVEVRQLEDRIRELDSLIKEAELGFRVGGVLWLSALDDGTRASRYARDELILVTKLTDKMFFYKVVDFAWGEEDTPDVKSIFDHEFRARIDMSRLKAVSDKLYADVKELIN
jgi:hypothetical protein